MSLEVTGARVTCTHVDSYLLLGPAGLLDDQFGDVGGLGVSHGLVSALAVLAGSPALCSLTGITAAQQSD